MQTSRLHQAHIQANRREFHLITVFVTFMSSAPLCSLNEWISSTSNTQPVPFCRSLPCSQIEALPRRSLKPCSFLLNSPLIPMAGAKPSSRPKTVSTSAIFRNRKSRGGNSLCGTPPPKRVLKETIAGQYMDKAVRIADRSSSVADSRQRLSRGRKIISE